MFHHLINLFFPRVCHLCDKPLLNGEEIICIKCRHELPVTNFSHYNDNPVKKVFYGRVAVENATALLHFQKRGNVQKLIHKLKYKGQQEIGIFLGKWAGEELINCQQFNKVDMVIPVPLHQKKLKIRGYNQVAGFGKEIAFSLQVPYVDDVLVKKSFSTTQTLKERLSRWGNIEETFVIKDSQKIKGKHLLLVDDLITTGATLEACARTLEQAENIKISVATMAITA